MAALLTPGSRYRLTPAPEPALAAVADSLSRTQRKSPTGAMIRSLLIPGWGQFYNGKWLKAILVFGLEAGFIGAAVYYNQKAQDASQPEVNRRFYTDQRNTNYWRTGVVILLSMLDAYVDAHLSDFDESPDLSFRIEPGRNAHLLMDGRGSRDESALVFRVDMRVVF